MSAQNALKIRRVDVVFEAVHCLWPPVGRPVLRVEPDIDTTVQFNGQPLLYRNIGWTWSSKQAWLNLKQLEHFLLSSPGTVIQTPSPLNVHIWNTTTYTKMCTYMRAKSI